VAAAGDLPLHKPGQTIFVKLAVPEGCHQRHNRSLQIIHIGTILIHIGGSTRR